MRSSLDSHSLDNMVIEAWDAIRHCAATLEIVHRRAHSQNAAKTINDRDRQAFSQEDNVTSPRDNNICLLLADGVHDTSDHLFWGKNVHREGILRTFEHSSADEEWADASRLHVTVVAILLQLASQGLIDGHGAPLTGAVISQACNSGHSCHGGDRYDVTLLVRNHVRKELANSVQVGCSVDGHRSLDHLIAELQGGLAADDASVVDQHRHVPERLLGLAGRVSDLLALRHIEVHDENVSLRHAVFDQDLLGLLHSLEVDI